MTRKAANLLAMALAAGLCFISMRGCRAFNASESLAMMDFEPEGTQYDVVQGLLQEGADPNFGFNGSRALAQAIEQRTSRVAALLIRSGADPQRIEPHYRRLALKSTHWDRLVEELRDHGLDVARIRAAFER